MRNRTKRNVVVGTRPDGRKFETVELSDHDAGVMKRLSIKDGCADVEILKIIYYS